MLLPILTDPCAASQHSYSATGLDLCYQASPLGTPVGHLLISLLLQCPASKSHHAPAQQAEQQRVSAIHPLLPRAFGEVTGCQPISLQPSWEISLHSGESHREMAFVFLCYGLAVVFNHDFFPASPRTFGFANLLPFSSQHHLMVIGFHFSQVLPFDASRLANFQPPSSLTICLNNPPVLLEYVFQPLTKEQ